MTHACSHDLLQAAPGEQALGAGSGPRHESADLPKTDLGWRLGLAPASRFLPDSVLPGNSTSKSHTKFWRCAVSAAQLGFCLHLITLLCCRLIGNGTLPLGKNMSDAAESISRKLSTAFRHDLRSWLAPVQAPGMTYDHLLQLQGEAPWDLASQAGPATLSSVGADAMLQQRTNTCVRVIGLWTKQTVQRLHKPAAGLASDHMVSAAACWLTSGSLMHTFQDVHSRPARKGKSAATWRAALPACRPATGAALPAALCGCVVPSQREPCRLPTMCQGTGAGALCGLCQRTDLGRGGHRQGVTAGG